MGKPPLSFQCPKLVLGDLLPKPIVFWFCFYSFLVFIQSVLIYRALYKAPILVRSAQRSHGTDLAGLSVLVMLDFVSRLIVNTSIGSQHLIRWTSVGVVYFVIRKIHHWIAPVVVRRMVFRRGIGRDAVLSADIQMLGSGVSLIGQNIHTFHPQEYFGVQCHWGERMGIVHATGIVVHKEFVLRIATGLHIVAHIDDVAVQDHGPCVRVGKADLALAALLQAFFYVLILFFF